MSSEPFAITPSEFAASDLFERTFSEGMGLVKETAAYLEGEGREEARELPRDAALAYAGESMRLTTTLMQIASWLLVHRAVRSGEMTDADARADRYRLEDERRSSIEGVEAVSLPERLTDLLSRAERLHARVARLDARMALVVEGDRDGPAPDPVGAQFEALAAAFGTPAPRD